MSAPGGGRSALRRARDVVQAILVAVLLALLVRTWVVQAFRIPTGSMEPQLRAGDHLLVNKFVYGPTRWRWERQLLPVRPPRRCDVIVFRFPRGPDRLFVKRVLGLPGQEVAIAARRLLVDGAPVDERGWARYQDVATYPDSGLLDPFYRRRDNFGPARVPADAYFVLGDNRDFSADSRYWGYVPRDLLVGRAFLVYLSPGSGGDALSAPSLVARLLHVVR